jgi:hypothetical protein
MAELFDTEEREKIYWDRKQFNSFAEQVSQALGFSGW